MWTLEQAKPEPFAEGRATTERPFGLDPGHGFLGGGPQRTKAALTEPNVFLFGMSSTMGGPPAWSGFLAAAKLGMFS